MTRANRDPRIVYVGTREYGACSVKRRGEIRNIPLRLDLGNHSPTGFEWGYGGAGPAQTALAILADYLGDDLQAKSLYQEFKWVFVSVMPHEGFEVAGSEIDFMLEKFGHAVVCGGLSA